MDKFETRFIDCQQSVYAYAITGVADKDVTRVELCEDSCQFSDDLDYARHLHSVKREIVRIDNLSAPNLEELIITLNIREIARNACRGLVSLRKVVFKGADIHIGDYAFWNNEKLAEVEMSDELLSYYPAFEGCPVYTALLDRYRAWVDKMEIVPSQALPNSSNLFCAFSGCKNIKTVDTRRHSKFSRHLDLTSAFAGSGIETAFVPSDAEKLLGAFTGCERMKTIFVDGAHRYQECGDAFGYVHAEGVNDVYFTSERPSFIGSTPNALWHVPQGSEDAYRKAVDEYNNSDQAALLGHYIYYKEIMPDLLPIDINEIDLNAIFR